jgi:uncharacterized repeat protein (TIGR03803 family)
LYGTATSFGGLGYGTVFAVNTDGTGFTVLHNFAGGNDGLDPQADLILLCNTLYGTATFDGDSGDGTLFAVNTDGTRYTNLYSFTGGNDGAYPQAGLILFSNTLYGTASQGGCSSAGTVFSFSLSSPPQLSIALFGANIILTWPTNVAGFTLQSTTNLAPLAVWTTVSPASVVVNTNNAVTNTLSGIQQFYRLIQ